MLKMEDLDLDNWSDYMDDFIKSLNLLDDIIKQYYSDFTTMSANMSGEMRQEIDMRSYFVAENMRPLFMCIPGWGVRVSKSKIESLNAAKKDFGSITAAKEAYKAYEPFAEISSTYEAIEAALRIGKSALDKAGGISNSIAYRTKGTVFNEYQNVEGNQLPTEKSRGPE